MSDIKADEVIDLKGLNCPMPMLKTKKALQGTAQTQLVIVAAPAGTLRRLRCRPGRKQIASHLVEQRGLGRLIETPTYPAPQFCHTSPGAGNQPSLHPGITRPLQLENHRDLYPRQFQATHKNPKSPGQSQHRLAQTSVYLPKLYPINPTSWVYTYVSCHKSKSPS